MEKIDIQYSVPSVLQSINDLTFLISKRLEVIFSDVCRTPK